MCMLSIWYWESWVVSVCWSHFVLSEASVIVEYCKPLLRCETFLSIVDAKQEAVHCYFVFSELQRRCFIPLHALALPLSGQPACPHTLPLSFSLSFCVCNLWLCSARVRDKACLPCTCHMDTNSRDTTSVILLKPKQNVKASQLLIVRAVQLNRRYFVHLKPFSQLISLIQRCPTRCPTIC